MRELTRRLLQWAPLGVACAVALGTAIAAKGPSPSFPADDAQKHALYDTIASEEPKMRSSAAKDFPTDTWSQDDDFHSLEYQRAHTLAGQRRIPLGDVLSALDEGMRERWPRHVRLPLITTVPPCRPRAIY